MIRARATELPIGWRAGKIGDLFLSWGGHTPSKSNPSYWGGDIPWISSRDVKAPRLTSGTHTVTQQAVKATGLRVCPPGSVIVVVRSGILAHTLPVTINQHPVTINQDLKAFYSDEPLMNEWLALFLKMVGRGLLASSRRDGTTVQSLPYSLLQDAVLPIPPAQERKHIIKAVTSALERQALITARLTTVRRAIEYLRKSVLAAACSGRLTVDWRSANPEALNVRQALIDHAARPPRRSREQAVDLELPDVPDSYVMATIGEASVLLEYGTSRRAESKVEGGIPMLRMGNIQDGALDLHDLKYCPLDRETERLLLKDGDFLFNRTNSPDLVGKSAVFRSSEPMTFASYLIRLRFAAEVADPDFVNYWINSAWGRAWARLAKTDGVSQSNINGSKLALMPIPLPPIEEQRVIVTRASRMLTTADRLTAQVERATRDIQRSSQAILAKAFRGGVAGGTG